MQDCPHNVQGSPMPEGRTQKRHAPDVDDPSGTGFTSVERQRMVEHVGTTCKSKRAKPGLSQRGPLHDAAFFAGPTFVHVGPYHLSDYSWTGHAPPKPQECDPKLCSRPCHLCQKRRLETCRDFVSRPHMYQDKNRRFILAPSNDSIIFLTSC